jgi:hypothetical protein
MSFATTGHGGRRLKARGDEIAAEAPWILVEVTSPRNYRPLGHRAKNTTAIPPTREG